ncbi:hypothetical protein GEMRC1_006704 [Eukaryota sp. GEM-RC1]
MSLRILQQRLDNISRLKKDIDTRFSSSADNSSSSYYKPGVQSKCEQFAEELHDVYSVFGRNIAFTNPKVFTTPKSSSKRPKTSASISKRHYTSPAAFSNTFTHLLNFSHATVPDSFSVSSPSSYSTAQRTLNRSSEEDLSNLPVNHTSKLHYGSPNLVPIHFVPDSPSNPKRNGDQKQLKNLLEIQLFLQLPYHFPLPLHIHQLYFPPPQHFFRNGNLEVS